MERNPRQPMTSAAGPPGTTNLDQSLDNVLKCGSVTFLAATVINPIFGESGSLIQVLIHHSGIEGIRNLKHTVDSVNQELDQLLQQDQNMLRQIRNDTLACQYHQVEKNLQNQFRKFMEMVEARPEHCERKKDDFKESYANYFGDQNLHTLYDGVVGTPMLFSRPILEVYLTHSQGDRHIMERLCTRLTYLFCIGLIALIGYSSIMRDDEEKLTTEWAEKMRHVREKMEETLHRNT